MGVKDIADEVIYWQDVVVCCILGVYPPFEVIEGYVRCIWKDFPIDKVMMIKRGLYLVRFVEQQDAVTVTQKGFHRFDHKLFIVKAWTPELEINIDPISSLPMES